MPAYGDWITSAITVALTSETVKAMLVDGDYVPDPDETSAPTGNEASGTGYTAGGVDVTPDVDISYDATGNRVVLTLTAPADFGIIDVTDVGGVVFYIDGGDPLVADMFGAGDIDDAFTYTPSADGLLVMQL